jgi:hypothetical protein
VTTAGDANHRTQCLRIIAVPICPPQGMIRGLNPSIGCFLRAFVGEKHALCWHVPNLLLPRIPGCLIIQVLPQVTLSMRSPLVRDLSEQSHNSVSDKLVLAMEGRTPRAVVRSAAHLATLNDVGLFAAPISRPFAKSDLKPMCRNRQTGQNKTAHFIVQTIVAGTARCQCGRLRLKHAYWFHSVLHL